MMANWSWFEIAMIFWVLAMVLGLIAHARTKSDYVSFWEGIFSRERCEKDIGLWRDKRGRPWSQLFVLSILTALFLAMLDSFSIETPGAWIVWGPFFCLISLFFGHRIYHGTRSNKPGKD